MKIHERPEEEENSSRENEEKQMKRDFQEESVRKLWKQECILKNMETKLTDKDSQAARTRPLEDWVIGLVKRRRKGKTKTRPFKDKEEAEPRGEWRAEKRKQAEEQEKEGRRWRKEVRRGIRTLRVRRGGFPGKVFGKSCLQGNPNATKRRRNFFVESNRPRAAFECPSGKKEEWKKIETLGNVPQERNEWRERRWWWSSARFLGKGTRKRSANQLKTWVRGKVEGKNEA